MSLVPEQCKGCPQLTQAAERFRMLDETMRLAADLTGSDNPGASLLNSGLEALEIVEGIPNRLLSETKTLLIDGYNNRSWASSLTFEAYLGSHYETTEPDQFKTIIDHGVWHELFPHGFDAAMGAFSAAQKNLKEAMEQEAGFKDQVISSSIHAHDAIEEMSKMRSKEASFMEELMNQCKTGLVKKRTGIFRERTRSCGSTAINGTTG